MLLGFDNCVGPFDITTGAAMSAWNRSSGDVPTASTTGVFRCKYSLQHDNSVGLRCDHFIPDASPDAYRWFTMDHYIATSEVVSGEDVPEWLILTSSYDYGAGVTHLGVAWERGAGVNRGKLHLYKFYFSGGIPTGYVLVASAANFDYEMLQRNRLQVRSIYNSGADTMDCEVWVEDTVGDPGNQVKEIDASGIAKIAGKDWEQDQYWNITQSEKAGGKGGTDFTTHTCNYIWNDEKAGIGPTGQPGVGHANPFHQINADTDDAARDDWTGGGVAPTAPLTAKYNYADDNNGADNPGDDYVMVDQSLTDEQEFAVANINDLGSATVVGISVIAEIREETGNGGQSAQLEATLHVTTAAAWTPDIFNSMMVIFRRLALDGDAEELRLYNACVIACGEDIDMPAENGAGGDNADETPTGEVLSYARGLRAILQSSSDPSYWGAFWFFPGDDRIGQTIVRAIAKPVAPILSIMRRIPIAAVVAAVRRIFNT